MSLSIVCLHPVCATLFYPTPSILPVSFLFSCFVEKSFRGSTLLTKRNTNLGKDRDTQVDDWRPLQLLLVLHCRRTLLAASAAFPIWQPRTVPSLLMHHDWVLAWNPWNLLSTRPCSTTASPQSPHFPRTFSVLLSR